MDLDEFSPSSSLDMSANNWSLPLIDDANDGSDVFQYIDLPHNTAAEGLVGGLSTCWPSGWPSDTDSLQVLQKRSLSEAEGGEWDYTADLTLTLT
jgi:hypothetical protein